MQCALLVTTEPIVSDPFVHALQDIREMLFLTVSGESVKVTANARIIRLALITNVSILAVASVEQEHNVKLKDIWPFAHAQLELKEML